MLPILMLPIEHLATLFAGPGASEYLGEPVSIATHMLQAGMLARRAGAPDQLVAAALLHDVGHLIGNPQAHGPGIGDKRHEELGATWLARWFAEDVTEPVRLHVAAKRYLCQVQPEYLKGLSPASVESLGLQGGPMTRDEATAFERMPYAMAAVAVRRWDEQAKDPTASAPSFDTFEALLRRLLTQHGRRRSGPGAEHLRARGFRGHLVECVSCHAAPWGK